jgi:hypothetical protein
VILLSQCSVCEQSRRSSLTCVRRLSTHLCLIARNAVGLIGIQQELFSMPTPIVSQCVLHATLVYGRRKIGALGALHSQRAEAMISNFSAGARTYENTMMQPVSWWRPCYGYYKPYYYPYYCRPYYYRSWYCPRPLYPYRAFKPCDCGQERRPTAGRTILVRIGAGISPHLWGLESPAAALSGHCPSPGPQFLFR